MKLIPSKNTVNIAGVQLPCITTICEDDEGFPSFVYENGSSPYNNIQQLALAVSCNRPVLLQGPVGSGKTCTVEYLAYITGHKQQYTKGNKSYTGFVKVQLGEQTDSRMLLGGYQSTEIPGKFIWKPGVLTNAVINGYWILLEDIDSTSSDVVTVIDNLIKNQSLSVPGFGDNIIPHPEFRLFATQRTLGYDSNSSVKCDVLKHWFIIQLKPLNCLELVGIICKRYPSLKCVANKMVSVLDIEHPVLCSDRIPSARDLLKWCQRCSKYFETGSFDVSIRVFQDAVDIFCGYMDKDFQSISEQIGLQLGIVKNKAFFLNDRYKPNISVTEKKLLAGRSTLERYETEIVTLDSCRSKHMIFSLTAPSCRLIEKVACCLENNEPVLLVGETGCGKTTVLQYMAKILGRNLLVINMNQQSDTADLIGGFKPVTFRWIMRPLCDKFESLFRKLFDAEKNKNCLNKFLILFNKENWDVLLKFISYVQVRAVNLINYKINKYEKGDSKYAKWIDRLSEWEELGLMVKKYMKQCEFAEKNLVFSFIEGSLVKAVKRGDWVLLDEINLATSETLDCLSGLLEDSRGSLLLLEKGENKPVVRDSGFRLFAAMNPATDVGKKRLPVGLRNRFTEFYVEELTDSLDLYPLVESYLMGLNYPPEKIKKIVNFYLKMKKDSKSNILDGNGKKPHYSLRNLCRALTVASKNLCGSAPRSLYEGLNLSFLTQLDRNSYNLVHGLVAKTASDADIKALINQPIPKPSGKVCVKIEGFWIPVGNLPPLTPENYILTDTVKRHLKDVIRVISLGSGIPILLEGDTSVGKTSLINYLAKCTGNFCARVNNHEHTDIQEYIGTYMADSNGKLVFKEGILCEAMRKGYWLILDELNLAPSEVLEALNRVLDDNRELYIPETQTVIKAHEKFMLFATQNPPGLYGGRKELSRAFKNRFIELQFSQIPSDELITILEKRCHMPLSYCKKMVAVMSDLQLRRRSSDIFIGKSGFITLRDLFRWGERYQKAVVKEKFHDWEQHLADEGYILLAGRVRLQEESKIIEEVICKHFKKKTCPQNLFSLHENTSSVSRHILENILSFSKSKTEFKHIVWTFSMRRLAVLVCKAIEFSEPVLLVGETGCGKTTVVQILALMRKQNLYSVNCHTHSDSADFLGGLRPVREESRTKGKLFEWCDGPLVQAMTTGSFFLADEISLADDSVLERLNSLLEPERTILLTEKGGGLIGTESEENMTVADDKFQFIGTMNPGGDYGKKELSPALRNRFTEIWVEVNYDKFGDYREIIKYNLKKPKEPLKSKVSDIIVHFLEWYQATDFGKRLMISVRDVMTWIDFMNHSNLEWFESCLHGCCLTFLDALGCGTALANNFELLHKFKDQCLQFLVDDIKKIVRLNEDISTEIFRTGTFVKRDDAIGIHPFYIALGKNTIEDENFFFNAPTTSSNTLRLLRGLQMNKAILLEGSPGVGKTSLVSSLAKISGAVPRESVWKSKGCINSRKPLVLDVTDPQKVDEEGFFSGFSPARVYCVKPCDKSHTVCQRPLTFVCEAFPLWQKKTSHHLQPSLSNHAWHKLTRINLSDQTDISDLFGADLPEEGATAGHFVWRDGPFLTALKNGHWILLDELNLALQSVLEGLNAVLDHRGYAFIPELNKTFYISKETKLFACQNPVKEGGSRRGLPKSLLNRFTQVYIEQLSMSDYLVILRNSFPEAATLKMGEYFIIDKMVLFNYEVCKMIDDGKIGCSGGPWEFNLRDITRWVEGIQKNGNIGESSLETIKKAVFDYANLLYFNRFRSTKDRDALFDLFESIFGYAYPKDVSCNVFVTEKLVLFGDETYLRNTNFFPGDLNEFEMFCDSENSFETCDIPEYRKILHVCRSYRGKNSLEKLRLLQKQYPVLRLLSQCVQKQWLAILVGDHGSGKTSCVRVLAALANQKLRTLSINSAMDTTEILGGFEQTDYNRHLDTIAESGKGVVLTAALRSFRKRDLNRTLHFLEKWLEFSELPIVDASSADTATAFMKRLNFLDEIMKCEALDFDPELKEMGKGLSRKLRNLKERQEKEESVTSGGKFEWVDSILVKCLEEGSWLVMEDVNLCSSAVLDRLNCLLEPNGCLPVGERGARADGSLVTIKPHPNFRLFFTMNPKNGHISRAMRNRGVEIYLMPDSQGFDWSVQDKLALINDVGITEMAAQKAVIKFENSRDIRNVSNLVGNAFWMAQYVKHGFVKCEAFLKSTQQVYKISSEEELNTVRELSLSLNSSFSYSISYARPPMNNYFIDDAFARLKQSCAFLNFLTEVLINHKNTTDKVPVEDLKHFIGYSAENLKISDGIRYSILYIYVLVSGPSVTLAPKLISSILKNLEQGGQWSKLSDSLGKVMEKPMLDELIRLPWDCRWYISPDTVLPLKNKTFLLLKFAFLLFHESRSCVKNVTDLENKETVNVAEYSEAVKANYLDDVLANYPVMAAYNFLLDGFDDVVRTCLNSEDVILSDTQVFWFLSAFKLRFWLGKMSDATVLTGEKRKPNEEIVTQVELYFLWFSHFVLEGGHTVFTNNATKVKYEKLTEKLKLAMRSDVSVALLKISNSFRRGLGHPSPDKYLLKKVSSMEVIRENDSFNGDSAILKKVLYNFVQHFHTCFLTHSSPIELSEIMSVAGNEMTPLKSLVEEYKKGDKGLSTEIMYHCLEIINSEYAFFDVCDEKAEEAYLKQVLPFHRAAWTCRIVHFLFRSPEKWNMINYRNSERELRDILATVFPQICSLSEMDIRRNEWFKLSVELARVEENLKKSLDCNVQNLNSFLTAKLKQNLTHSEKRFFKKVLTVMHAISTMSFNSDSAYYVYGCLWVFLGLLEVIVLQVARMDPIRKKMLKAKLAKYEVDETEPEIKTFEVNTRIAGASSNHPLLINWRKRVEISRQKIVKYNNLENVKRDAVKFNDLCQEVNSFLDLTDQVLSFCQDVLACGETFDQREQRILCGRARLIRNKNRHFKKNVRKDFITFFADLAYPFLAGAAQIEHGMNLITSELLRRPFPKDIRDLINNFCTYPIPAESRHPYHLVKALSWCVSIKDTLETDKLLLLFSSCRIKCNEYMTFKTKEKYEELIGLFTIFVEFWKREEEKRLQKNKEEESFYLKKGGKKCETLTEEEELKEEQSKLFPTYEKEFEEEVESELEDWKSVASPEQLSQVAQMHMKVVKECARFNWISHKSWNRLSQDFLTPLKLRYLLLSHILPHISFLLDYEMDLRLLPSLLPLIHAKEFDSLSTQVNLIEDDNKIYDFYKDKNVSEANKCLDLLIGLKVRCLELLEQWPEHPALVQMNVVIQRILSFSVESPLMKFLTGLEILLQNCQHWESVAHAGVSIADYLISITNLIIEWRKLELQGWKNCFEIALIRMKTGASKWWYHIWALIEEYFSEGEKTSLAELLQTLYNFIETSPMGEYETRLDILLSFHCHLTRLEVSEKRDKLAVAFWNLYVFYSQYISEVSKRLENLSAPVAKKLRDYVKIAKWNDITYWSVKQAVDKSHRSLLKYIKEYEGILKQRVDLKTIDPSPNLESKKNVAFQDINQFLRKIVFDVRFKNSKLSLRNPDKKFDKASAFCTEIVLTAEYPNLILQLEYLSQEICENAEYFKSLDVDRTLSKEKQKSHAKSIVHQKRRALADLFKNLRTIGLSYQTGTSIKEFGVFELCQTVPLIESRRVECDTLSGEDYYLKTVSRRLVLDSCLLTPSKEIGPAIIERLRGYASHFMDINRKQKLKLSRFEASFQELCRYKNLLSDMTNSQSLAIPDQEMFRKSLLNLQETIDSISYEINQFHLILNSWPTEGDKLKKMNFLGESTPQIMISSIFEEPFTSAREKFDGIRRRIEKLTKCVESVTGREHFFTIKFKGDSFSIARDDFSFYYMRDVEKYNSCLGELKEVVKDIDEFRLKFVNDNMKNFLTQSLEKIGRITFDTFEVLIPKTTSSPGVQKDIHNLIQSILLIVQKILKKYKVQKDVNSPFQDIKEATGEGNDNGEEEEEEEGNLELLEDHITKKLVGSLESDFADLNIEHTNELILSVLKQLSVHAAREGFFVFEDEVFLGLCSAVPFVQQYSVLCSYFLEQQRMCYRSCNKLSSLLIGVFIQVAQKGFCIPPEYEEDAEGAGDHGCGGGMGMGEGEGTKDVSDRIESEDQLEGAEPQGKENKEEEREFKEEEKGIEMSEDFDGKAQDIEKKEDEEDEEDEEEEPDVKEMGDTEEGAEKLEKELWSSDEENEENENEKKEETGRGQGKQTTEDKYAGKESDVGEDECEQEIKEKRKDDIDEINEQEDNGDQIDPYHGNHESEHEPEPFELPDDINLDDGEAGDKEEGEEENPFDIDAMKEVKCTEEPEEKNDDEKTEDKKEEEMEEDSRGDEESNEENVENTEETMEVDENGSDKIDEGSVEKDAVSEGERAEDEEKKQKQVEEFEPSDDKPAAQPAQAAPESEKDELASKDEVVGSSQQPQFQTKAQEVSEKPQEESEGTGQAEIETMKDGHEVGASNKEKVQPGQSNNEEEKERNRKRPGKIDEDRTLAENYASSRKKMKTFDKPEKDIDDGNDEAGREESELFEHVNEKTKNTVDVIDAATKEQAESRPVPNKEEEAAEEAKEDDIAMDMEEKSEEKKGVEELQSQSQKIEHTKKKDGQQGENGQDEEENTAAEMKDDIVETATVPRGPETTYHTNPLPTLNENVERMQVDDGLSVSRPTGEQIQPVYKNEGLPQEEIQAWHVLNSRVEELSRDLSEQLRLILEPSKATRLKGDFRTGRRINMRKIISYIASEFRKDNIWLRRTKPWKREHEIVLAIDDSSSMDHNNSKELAFESLALVSKALSLLEAGDLGVISFGERTRVVHPLGEPFTEDSGAKLIREFTFCQNKTLITEMLDVSCSMMGGKKKKGDVSQLLIILSDGRGVFSEGLEKVKLAVRRATDQGIFLVFVIIDEPLSKDSIMDVRMPEFKDGKFLGIKCYLEEFPFPYYMILRDIGALPSTLGDALRQWFQLITCKNPA